MQHTEAGKRAAAEAAIALVESGMRVGLGSGSTMRYALDALGRRMRDEGLPITGIPTSERIAAQARRLGIPLGDCAALEAVDLALDGADEVERGTLRLIKGLGGALLREKIVMEASRRFVIVVDALKIVTRLGSRMALPVEVVRFGHGATARRIAQLGGMPVLRVLDDAPFVSDSGNLVYDCRGFGEIADPHALDRQLKTIAGVVETGLFVGAVEQCFVGAADGSVTVLRPGDTEVSIGGYP